MSKIKIVEKNNLLVEEANRIFERILSMQSEAESQIRDIKSIEKKIMDIQKKKQIEETLLSEKKAMEKIIEMRKADQEKEAVAAAVGDTTAIASNAEQKETLVQEKPAQNDESIKNQEPVAARAQENEKTAEPAKKKPEINMEKKAEEPEPREEKNASAAKESRPEEHKRAAAPAQTVTRRQERPAASGRDQAPRAERPVNRDGFTRPAANNANNNDRRPASPRPQPRGKAPAPDFAPAAEKPKAPYDAKKFKKSPTDETKNRFARKNSIKVHGAVNGEDEFRRGSRKRRRKQQPKPVFEPIIIEKAVITSETLSVKLFAEKIGKPVSEILKKLLLLGMMCNINSQIDFDTASLIADEFGIELEKKIEQTAEEVLTSTDEEEDDPKNLGKRPPIITIMGHVDHGKTSLLDKIRSTKVTESEAGGITQHIGAYQIDVNGNLVTFIDTPGHEAFTAMRARGAQVTDVAILVVAADDGVMPQTIEAINHAKSAGVPIIVAINKIDKEGANPEKIKQALTEYDLVAEEWGGDTVMVPVSAITGEGIDHLLDMIVLVTDVLELKANPGRMAKGTIVEAKLDKGRGPVATVLIQNGTLRVQDTIVAGMATGRVRAMVDDHGKITEEAGPSKPVEVIGFSEVPEAGDVLYAVEQDKLSKQVVEERKDKQKAEMLKKMNKVSLDDLFNQIAEGQIKDLNIIIKADVQGSVEAVKQSLEKLSGDEVRVKAIHCGVGAIKETDVMLASAANAIIIGFNVRPEAKAKAAAEHEKVDIRLYRIIYKAIEDITSAMKGLLEPEFEEITLGHVEVRQTFKVSNVGTIAGCYVTDGKITRNSLVRLLRDNVVVHEGKISSLKRFKDDAKEVAQGYECGVSLENYNDIKEGDVLESYVIHEKER